VKRELLDTVKARKLAYYGHIMRKQGSCLEKTDKKLSYRQVTARCVLSVVILPITTQQYRNYLYKKS